MRDFKRSSSSSRETKKIRKILNEEIKLGIHQSSDSETEEVDFQKELHPLSHYMNNREEMIDQMFSIIKGDKLKNMLPPILKDMPLDELKADCLIHLLGMSKKRIKAILEGKEINSSSDSETHSDNSSPRKGAKPFMKPMIIKQEGCSDISDNSEEVILIDPDLDPVQQSATSKAKNHDGKVKSKKRRKKKLHLKNTNMSISQTISKKIQEVDKSGDESSPESTSNTEDNPPKEGKTLLEILELEMRARAIRALLHKTDSPVTEGKLPENQNPVEAEKSNTTESKPERKLRKKKRKNDDVIVITPKLITIDLTDENNYPSTARKKPKDLSTDKQVENIDSSDIPKEVETTKKSETVGISNERVNVTELEDCSKKTDEEKEPLITNASIELGHCSKQSNLEDLQKAKNEKSNWAQRWLESKEVKKVVSTSKICGNIRKRIKNAKLAKQNQVPLQEDQNKQGPHTDEVKSQEIEGSVDEYQLLPKSIIVFNANPSDAGNSELSSVSNEGNSGGIIDTTNKETSSSGEQVQDVTSTKCESPKKEETSCQESPLLCESIQEMSTGNSNSGDDSNSLISPNDNNEVDSNHIILESTNVDANDSQNRDLDSNKNESIDSKSDTYSCSIQEEKEKHTSSPQSNEAQFDDECLESVSKICLKEELSNAELYPKTGALSESISSSENEKIQYINKPHEKKLDGLESNLTDSSKFCDLKSNSSKVKSPSPPIEPETLEINITDEDRDIDGICDDKSELDINNTTKEVIIEIN